MQEFYRSTVIQAQTKIRRARVLPKGGEIVVRVGQEVSPTQVVARTTMASDFAILPAAKKLGVAPNELSDYLVMEKGARVEAGAVLAARKRVLGGRQVTSPVDGIFFDVINGRIAIQPTSDWLELRAAVAGRIVSYVSNRGVMIETSGSLVQAAWGSGKEGVGPLKIMANSATAILTPEHLNLDVTGQILAIGVLNDPDLFYKAEDLGVRGLIVGSATAEVCRASKSASMPLIVTDSVGSGGMCAPIFQLLQQADGRTVSLFGEYNVDAGQRPEIILPQASAIGLDSAVVKKALEPGQVVRILGTMQAGQMGTIKHVYSRLQATAIGMKVPGVDVVLSDGRELFVPTANIDVIV